MTRDKILGMEPGRKLDAWVAEKVFKWRNVHGPKTDYDGPCESFDVLVPPTIDDPFPLYPPRGAIKPWYFCRKWSTDISAAWEVVEKLKEIDMWAHIHCRMNIVTIYADETDVEKLASAKRVGLKGRAVRMIADAYGATAPEAIVKAALIAMEVQS